MTSILYWCHLQPTMLRFRRAEIYTRGCGSSMDPEVKASSVRPPATCRLLKSRSGFLVVYVDIGHSRNKHTFCLVQLAHNFLQGFYHPVKYSIGLFPTAIFKTYLEHAR